MKRKINWNYVVYLIRKGISKVGWMGVGAYLVAMLEYAVDKWTISGLVLAFALAILANVDNEKP